MSSQAIILIVVIVAVIAVLAVRSGGGPRVTEISRTVTREKEGEE